MGNLSEGFYKDREVVKASDEISLAELLHVFISNWKTFVTVVAVTLVAALVYAFSVTPRYTASLSYGYEIGGVDILNSVPGINYQEDRVLGELSLLLGSYENFKDFSAESNLERDTFYGIFQAPFSMDGKEKILRGLFNKNITVRRPSAEGDSRYLIEIDYSKGVDGTGFLNSYFQWTLAKYKQQLVSRVERSVADKIRHNKAEMEASLKAYVTEVDSEIIRLREADEIRLAQLSDRLEAEKQAVMAARLERVRVLKEAEQIASRLGIEMPTTPYDLGRHEASRDVIYAEINSQGKLPLYFMGTLALQAEREVIESNLKDNVKTAEIRDIEKEMLQLENNRTIEALLEREDNSPFNEHFAKLEKENALLGSYQISAEDVEIVKVFQWAYQADAPSSPRAALLIALALVLGCVLGMLGVALHVLWKQVKGIKAA